MPNDSREKRIPPAVFGFLLPNFLGFLIFTLFPVLLSFWMAFTNWTLKPAVKFEVLGLRNFNDLLGVRAVDQPHPGLEWAYALAAVAVCAGLVGALWANVAGWRGTRSGGVILLDGSASVSPPGTSITSYRWTLIQH